MEIVLGRVGHYSVPQGKDPDAGASCQTAVVVHVWTQEMINVVAWTSSGDQQPHTSVPVQGFHDEPGSARFHLTRDCPWNR